MQVSLLREREVSYFCFISLLITSGLQAIDLINKEQGRKWRKKGILSEIILCPFSVNQPFLHVANLMFLTCIFKYADPVADLLDRWGVFRARLFRESCVFHRGNYVKDLSRLGRELSKVIIVDNSPASYIFHPENAVSIQSTPA